MSRKVTRRVDAFPVARARRGTVQQVRAHLARACSATHSAPNDAGPRMAPRAPALPRSHAEQRIQAMQARFQWCQHAMAPGARSGRTPSLLAAQRTSSRRSRQPRPRHGRRHMSAAAAGQCDCSGGGHATRVAGTWVLQARQWLGCVHATVHAYIGQVAPRGCAARQPRGLTLLVQWKSGNKKKY